MKLRKSSPVDPSLDDELEALIGAYRKSVIPMLEELAQLLEAPTRKGARENARRIAHRLHGTSGSYGLLDVSRLTGEIQDLLDQNSPKSQLAPYANHLRNLAHKIAV